MEFDELQKIWDSQTKEPLWAINETALHNRISAKKQQASHITNVSELILFVVNLGAAAFMIGLNFIKSDAGNLWLYLMAAWMIGTAVYVLVNRLRRLNGSHTFDRSLLGELRYAVSLATYQVRLSQLMRWNIVPIVLLSMLGVWKGEQSIGIVLAIGLFFILIYFASRWEHGIYTSRKRELEALQNKLEKGI